MARHPGRRTRGPAAEADRIRAETARQDRSLPHQEGGHQGPVLGRRGPGTDLRGGNRCGRADGGRRPGDAARGRQDRKHEGPRRRRVGELEAAGTFEDLTQLGSGEDDIDRQLKELSSQPAVDDELAKMKGELGAGRPAALGPDRRRQRRQQRRPAGRETARMIVRISGEDQYELADDERGTLDELEIGSSAIVRRAPRTASGTPSRSSWTSSVTHGSGSADDASRAPT